MNGIFIIPTGIGCAIGGHAGDAVCAVNLIASLCDNLVVNPNAVNASDINEMASNCLYVEGSNIDRFLADETLLQKSRRNKILLVVNKPVSPHTVNSANAAMVSLGVDIEIVELDEPLVMRAFFEKDGTAGGEVGGVESLGRQVHRYEFDALAVQSPIDVDNEVVEHYLTHGGVNPWGGIEARVSKMIAREIGGRPIAHAPQQREDDFFKNYEGVPDLRMSAEMVSVSYIHCVFKGLARAPRSVSKGYTGMDGIFNLGALAHLGLHLRDFDFLITPWCFGPAHEGALKNGIEIIIVRENSTVAQLALPATPRITIVENYLEAAGVIACRRIGIGEKYVRADL